MEQKVIVSPIPTPDHQKPFHYCINQTMQPHPDPMMYWRTTGRDAFKPNAFRAWFIKNNVRDEWLEKDWMKLYATITYHMTLLERLLTVRTEWSRK